MSNCQCKWCERSYNYGDGVMHREKLDFCSERCRNEARSSGWKSQEEKFTERVNKVFENNPPRIETDKEIRRRRYEKNFEKFWWNIAIPIVAFVCASIQIHHPNTFFYLKWPPTSIIEWIISFLFAMCLMFPVLYIVATIYLIPVILISSLIFWVILNFVE